ncbi:MAG: hypothetical protein JSS66_13685 [Armatimonadetes bacterium]|nr:hypothetical protein [Armatimonadota bacterium]
MGTFRTVLLAMAALGAGLALAQDQNKPKVARPIKVNKVHNDSIAASDMPNTLVVLFGNATVGAAEGADPSTVNMVQMKQSLLDVSRFGLPIDMMVSLGGLVTNKVDDAGQTMVKRLERWRSALQDGPVKSKFYSTFGCEGLGSDGKVDPAARMLWQDWTSKNGWASVSPQSKSMDFTLRQGGDLYLFLDTESGPGINSTWLKEQLSKAAKERQTLHVFVFGYRPVTAPTVGEASKEQAEFLKDPTVAEARKAMSIDPKVVGYFCGSPGMTDLTPLEKGSQVNQVIVGNAGGAFAPGWNPPGGPQFGFAVLQILSSGTVSLLTFNRLPPPEGQAPYVASPTAPSAARFAKQVVLWSVKPKN